MGKIEDAIKKINLQIQMSPNDKYRALIGEYIIDQIQQKQQRSRFYRRKRH